MRRAAILALPLVTVLLAALSLKLGAVEIPWRGILAWAVGAEAEHSALLTRYRGPRALAAALVGALLGVSGLVMQATLRNPLADPTLFGVSGGASLAVVGATMLLVWTDPPEAGRLLPADHLPLDLVPVVALAGALAASAAMLALAWDGGIRPRRTALIGVILGAILAALVMTCVHALPEAQTQLAILWLSGSLYARDAAHLLPALPWALAGLLAVAALTPGLAILRFDAATAGSLGLRVGATRFALIIVAAVLAAAAVSIAGPVGFVGLLVPHLVRVLGIAAPWAQIWACLWIGAGLVMLADGVGRVVAQPLEVPVGIMTSLIGAPVLILLLARAPRPA